MTKKLLMNNYSENGLMPVTDGLICWLDARDLKDTNDGTIWKDRSGNGHHATLKRKDLNIIPVIEDGFYRTYESGYVILPTFNFNSTDGLTMFGDFKLNNAAKIEYGRLFTLGFGTTSNTHLGVGTGYSEVGIITYFGEAVNPLFNQNMYNQRLNISIAFNNNFLYAINHDCSVKQRFAGNNLNGIFNNNYLNAEHPSYIMVRDTSYGSFLIYNRTLTEEEINQNYLYEQSIKRGE